MVQFFQRLGSLFKNKAKKKSAVDLNIAKSASVTQSIKIDSRKLKRSNATCNILQIEKDIEPISSVFSFHQLNKLKKICSSHTKFLSRNTSNTQQKPLNKESEIRKTPTFSSKSTTAFTTGINTDMEVISQSTSTNFTEQWKKESVQQVPQEPKIEESDEKSSISNILEFKNTLAKIRMESVLHIPQESKNEESDEKSSTSDILEFKNTLAKIRNILDLQKINLNSEIESQSTTLKNNTSTQTLKRLIKITKDCSCMTPNLLEVSKVSRKRKSKTVYTISNQYFKGKCYRSRAGCSHYCKRIGYKRNEYYKNNPCIFRCDQISRTSAKKSKRVFSENSIPTTDSSFKKEDSMKSIGTQVKIHKVKKDKIPQSLINNLIKKELKETGLENQISTKTLVKIQNQFMDQIKCINLAKSPVNIIDEVKLEKVETIFKNSSMDPSIDSDKTFYDKTINAIEPIKHISCSSISAKNNNIEISNHSISTPQFQNHQGKNSNLVSEGSFFLIQDTDKIRHREEIKKISKLFSDSSERYIEERPKLLYHVNNSSFFTTSGKTDTNRFKSDRTKKRYTTFLEYKRKNQVEKYDIEEVPTKEVPLKNHKTTEISRFKMINECTQYEEKNDTPRDVYNVITNFLQNEQIQNNDKLKSKSTHSTFFTISNQRQRTRNRSETHLKRNREITPNDKKVNKSKKIKATESHETISPENDLNITTLIRNLKELGSKRSDLVEVTLCNLIKDIIFECTSMECQRKCFKKYAKNIREPDKTQLNYMDNAVRNLVEDIKPTASVVKQQKSMPKKVEKEEYHQLIKRLKELEKVTKELSTTRKTKKGQVHKIYNAITNNNPFKCKENPDKNKKLPVAKIVINVDSLKTLPIENKKIKQDKNCPLCCVPEKYLEKDILYNHKNGTICRDQQSYTITIVPKDEEKKAKPTNSSDFMKIKMVRKKIIKSNEKMDDSSPEEMMRDIAKEYLKKEFNICNENVISHIATDLIQNHLNLKNMMKYNTNLEMAYKRMVNFCMFKGIINKEKNDHEFCNKKS